MHTGIKHAKTTDNSKKHTAVFAKCNKNDKIFANPLYLGSLWVKI